MNKFLNSVFILVFIYMSSISCKENSAPLPAKDVATIWLNDVYHGDSKSALNWSTDSAKIDLNTPSNVWSIMQIDSALSDSFKNERRKLIITIRDVREKGDTAMVTYVVSDNAHEQNLLLIKQNGKWLIASPKNYCCPCCALAGSEANKWLSAQWEYNAYQSETKVKMIDWLVLKDKNYRHFHEIIEKEMRFDKKIWSFTNLPNKNQIGTIEATFVNDIAANILTTLYEIKDDEILIKKMEIWSSVNGKEQYSFKDGNNIYIKLPNPISNSATWSYSHGNEKTICKSYYDPSFYDSSFPGRLFIERNTYDINSNKHYAKTKEWYIAKKGLIEIQNFSVENISTLMEFYGYDDNESKYDDEAGKTPFPLSDN